MKSTFTLEEAIDLGHKIGIDFTKVDIDQFRKGVEVEFEHGGSDPDTNITDDDIIMTGRIAWAHLKELPDYYTRLTKIEDV